MHKNMILKVSMKGPCIWNTGDCRILTVWHIGNYPNIQSDMMSSSHSFELVSECTGDYLVHINIFSDKKGKVELRFLCVKVRMCTHTWISSEGRAWAVLIQQQGKSPAMVAMVNMDPCLVLAVHSSSSHPLSYSTVSDVRSLLLSVLPSLLASSCLFTSSHSFFLPRFGVLSLLPSLPPLILPSRHSDLPTGSRQALRAAQKNWPSVHHGNLTGRCLAQEWNTTPLHSWPENTIFT